MTQPMTEPTPRPAAAQPTTQPTTQPASSHPLGTRGAVRFRFDGGALSHVGVRLLAAVVTIGTLGFGFPLGFVLVRRWKATHLTVDGRRLAFNGSARELLARWVPWWILTLVTLGVYGLWVYPRVARWAWERTDFATTWHWTPADGAVEPQRPLAPPSRLHLAFFADAGTHQLVG
jgi:hypothetical protein